MIESLMSISLREARSLVADYMQIAEAEAEAWLLERFRRAELRAWCEWGYIVEPHGSVIFGKELTREQWILFDRIDWVKCQISIDSKAAKELRSAIGVYLYSEDLLSLIEVAPAVRILDQNQPRSTTRGRRRGPRPIKIEQVCSMMRGVDRDVLQSMKIVSMKKEFDASACTCTKARDRVLSETRNSGNQLRTMSDSNK